MAIGEEENARRVAGKGDPLDAGTPKGGSGLQDPRPATVGGREDCLVLGAGGGLPDTKGEATAGGGETYGLHLSPQTTAGAGTGERLPGAAAVQGVQDGRLQDRAG